MDPESPYYRQLTNTVQGETLTSFLTKRFQRVGPTTAVKFAEYAKFKPEQRILDSAVRKLKVKVTKTGKMTGKQMLAIGIFRLQNCTNKTLFEHVSKP